MNKCSQRPWVCSICKLEFKMTLFKSNNNCKSCESKLLEVMMFFN